MSKKTKANRENDRIDRLWQFEYSVQKKSEERKIDRQKSKSFVTDWVRPTKKK